MKSIDWQIIALTDRLHTLPKDKQYPLISKIKKLKKQLEQGNKNKNWDNFLAN